MIGVANGSWNFIFEFRLEPTVGPVLFVKGIRCTSRRCVAGLGAPGKWAKLMTEVAEGG